jgi:hypothetical protein
VKRLGKWPRIRFPTDTVSIPAWLEYVFLASYAMYFFAGLVAAIYGVPGVSKVTLPWYIHVYATFLVTGAAVGAYAFRKNLKRVDLLATVWLYAEACAVALLVSCAAIYFGSVGILAVQGDASRAFLAGQLQQQFLLPLVRLALILWELKKVYARRLAAAVAADEAAR